MLMKIYALKNKVLETCEAEMHDIAKRLSDIERRLAKARRELRASAVRSQAQRIAE